MSPMLHVSLNQMTKRKNNVVKRQRIAPSSVYGLIIIYLSTYILTEFYYTFA